MFKNYGLLDSVVNSYSHVLDNLGDIT